jgi:hypothetical protein
VRWVVPPLSIQLALVVTCIAMLVVIGRRSVSEMFSGAHQIMVGRRV